MNRLITSTLTLFLSAGIGAFAAEEHKHDHAKDHAKDHGHEHEKAVEVGVVTIGTTKVEVEMAGAVKAGKEVHVELNLTPAAPAPKAVRVWIGSDSGRGSEKAKATSEAAHPGSYEAHVAVPAPLPEGSKIWISIDPASGDAVKGSLPLPGSDTMAPHDDHQGHDHGDDLKHEHEPKK